VGIHGVAFAELLNNPATAPAVEPWARPGVHRPAVPPALEWRLQQQICLAGAFVERANLVDAHPAAALEVAAEEVVGALVAALLGAEPARPDGGKVSPARRRVVQNAIDLMESSPNEPVSVSSVCRSLQVSERALQRAFKDSVGVGPRAFERERRLRAVHGMILMEGDRRSITDIAMSFGFWHLGRFAAAYGNLFGCAPSETRRHVWENPARSAIA
jgi:transcriptional regulator GlxA family with amidase domain